MNQRIEGLRKYILDKKHHQFRRTADELNISNLSDSFARNDVSPVKRAAICLATLLDKEIPVILPDEKIVLTRTISEIPEIFTREEWDEIKKAHYIHERGTVCNISPDYGTTIRVGLEARKKEIEERLKDMGADKNGVVFLQSTLICISALQSFIDKYERLAREQKDYDTADMLKNIRSNGANSLREALQLLRILHFALWEAGNYHNTLGRFDQYMYPYYRKDIDNGILTKEEAFELVEEFFLVCNKDSDLYPGMQQGDNGQSIVLGGCDANGDCLFNELSEICLKASYELGLIDPKINIRVDKHTPDKVFELGSWLTKKGLGFPQYCNDDVVIPGLLRKGYEKEDAYNYVVAACWEFIIPKYALDIPNIDGLSLIQCVKECLDALDTCNDYESFYQLVEQKCKLK